ncbi:MAG: hypothetical protein U0133_06505 [Gemmatimonadales bacterium]
MLTSLGRDTTPGGRSARQQVGRLLEDARKDFAARTAEVDTTTLPADPRRMVGAMPDRVGCGSRGR